MHASGMPVTFTITDIRLGCYGNAVGMRVGAWLVTWGGMLLLYGCEKIPILVSTFNKRMAFYKKWRCSTPRLYSWQSEKIWWLCSKGHEYERTIHKRSRTIKGCPYCSGKRVGSDNNLLVLFPEIVREWNPTKNGTARPEHFTYGSTKSAWWLCPKKHAYETTLNQRTTGRGFIVSHLSYPRWRTPQGCSWQNPALTWGNL